MDNIIDPDRVHDCSLSGTERQERLVEWGDLGAIAMAVEQIEGGVASTHSLNYRDVLEDLIEREATCCGSWLDTSLEQVGGLLRLEITTKSSEGVDLVRSIAGFES